MTRVAVIVSVAGFVWGIASAIAWPARSATRHLSLGGALTGCAAALMFAGEVLVTGNPIVLGLPGVFHLLGGLSIVVDRLGAFFLALIAITGIAASVYGVGYLAHHDDGPRGRGSLAVFNVFLAGLCLVPAAGNMLTFLFGWELMAVASYVLVVSDPDQEGAPAAGMWYAVMTHAGFAALIAAFLTLGGDGPLDFDSMRAHAVQLPPASQTWIFALALFAFGSKAGLVPVHVWLPRAHPAAPSHVSALMSAAMVKLGVYGCIRFFFDLMPPGPAWWGGVILLTGLATALTGVLYSVTETHVKRVLAYSTIENIGIIFVGVGFAMLMRGYDHQGLAAIGLIVALLHTLNHALFKTLMFLAGGAVVHAVHAGSLEACGGLIKRMPQTAVLTFIGVMSLAALPPFNGFPSEWLTFQFLVAGARHTAPELAILLPLALGGVALTAGLAAVSAVRLFGITFLALPRSQAAADAVEPTMAMRIGMALPAIACVALGILPSLPLSLLGGVVADLHLPGDGLESGMWLMFPLVMSRLWPAGLALCLVGTTLVVALMVRRSPRRMRADVWNCGRMAQSSRTEYTAASFAEPLRRVFTGFYRPTQQVTIDTHPVSRYFVRSIAYRGHVAPWLEQAIYVPLVTLVEAISGRVRRLQAGSIHLYLTYLALALVTALLLSHWIER